MSSKSARKKKAGNMLVPIILGAAFVIFLVVFAFQTWFLVDWLFPSTNLFMKIGTVGSFDVMSIVWAAADTFYGFWRWRSKHIVQAMWAICFILATTASIIQLYLASTTRLDFVLDPNVIKLAYGLVIASLVGNLVALTFVFKLEWAASHPSHVEEDFEVQEDSTIEYPLPDDLDTEELDDVPAIPSPRAQATQPVKGRLKGAIDVLRGKGAPQAAPQTQPAMNEEQMYEWLERANRRIEERARREEAMREEARRRVDAQDNGARDTHPLAEASREGQATQQGM